jgi:hypothetical protein
MGTANWGVESVAPSIEYAAGLYRVDIFSNKLNPLFNMPRIKKGNFHSCLL